MAYQDADNGGSSAHTAQYHCLIKNCRRRREDKHHPRRRTSALLTLATAVVIVANVLPLTCADAITCDSGSLSDTCIISRTKAETEPARFRRKSNSNEQRTPLVGGVIKSSQAEQVWSYVCFEMGDVWIVQPGAHIQLPKGNYGVTLIGLPTGTVIQPPKHCEFATEDIPRKKAFVVRKADRRRSWRIQQGATLRIPTDLLEPFLIGLPVGTTVVDDETAIRGRVGEEDLDIVHDLSKHDGLFSGNKSRCVEGLDSASRRKRLLAYFDRIHAEIELRQVGSQYTSTFLEWRRHGSSLLRRQSSSSGGAGGGTEAVDKSAMLARIAARARMLSALVFSGMLSLIGFTTTMDS